MQHAPTLEQRLRYIDLVFECTREAERILIEAGEISATKPWQPDMPTPRGKAIARLATGLCIEAMEREGLPYTLLPEGERPVRKEAA